MSSEYFNHTPDSTLDKGDAISEPVIGSVTKELTDLLAEDPRTKTAVIDLIFDRGVATLMGTVANIEIKETAIMLVKHHPQVIAVHSELHIE